jgi:hypothetical protein
VADLKPDIIMICEAWTSPEITNAELSVEGYNLEVELRKDREDTLNGIGGGLLIYTKIGLVIRKNLKFDKIKFNQFCALTVIAKDPLNLLLVYRPPNSGINNTEELCRILDQAGENSALEILTPQTLTGKQASPAQKEEKYFQQQWRPIWIKWWTLVRIAGETNWIWC